ncbi:CHAD domain-containing protein [Streptomyces pilosus]|uniref:CHAD domain-containing protein n=1 Tax=Streptomyces pilosus TaxID=28893 RepID=UPI0016762B0C|nr:CHAD domain-containing protein [Streptomyces pilosus]GGV64179.1 CHAD domain-containing protein [Streptomyces pilosus]
MAQRHPDPTAGPVPADALAGYLRDRATEFLRALRLHRETGAGAAASEDSVEAARALRRAARRISAGLHTFQPVLDPGWAEALRPELAWVSGTLAQEHACTARLNQLLLALHRLSGAAPFPAPARATATRSPAACGPPSDGRHRAVDGTTAPARRAATVTATVTTTVPEPAPATAPAAASDRAVVRAVPAPDRGNLTVGAAKAGALLDRQLTLARTRAHSTALQALGSSRFHAIADKVALLASEVPLSPAADGADLRPMADAARERLTDAVTALPLLTAGSPYNAEALIHGLSPDPSPHPQDAAWHQVRLLLRLHRYAREVLRTAAHPCLLTAGEALDRHRDASEAAAAAAQAARTPRIAPATAYALGVLHADQRHEVEAARYAFQRAWQKEALGTS